MDPFLVVVQVPHKNIRTAQCRSGCKGPGQNGAYANLLAYLRHRVLGRPKVDREASVTGKIGDLQFIFCPIASARVEVLERKVMRSFP